MASCRRPRCSRRCAAGRSGRATSSRGGLGSRRTAPGRCRRFARRVRSHARADGPRRASRRAKARALSRSGPVTSSSTTPSARASCADIGLPLVISSSARAGPTSRGRRCVPPAPGSRPMFTSGRPSLQSGVATPKVAAEGDLQSAAQRMAPERGDDRLRGRLDRGDHVAPARAGDRLAELADVRPGNELAVFADQHDGA